ncbi:hypothetical protein BCR43DRAFT_497579 [Syncephalastrum racemosum]|uniref:Uncharacterized protein n=1 Tax=Syncephalastrum racemosum TaxID=13706 RepID=A0A1X2H2E7_SYNRA|nr:hypothetical protein BCR43DRAFT_497579 [Syncephalastrum racemosum]
MARHITDSTLLEEDGPCAASDHTGSSGTKHYMASAAEERRFSLPVEEAAVAESTTTEGDQQQQQSKIEDEPEKLTPWQKIMASPYLFALLPVAAGTAVAFQAGTNAAMNKAGGRAFSALLNFLTGTSMCLIFFSLDLFVLKTPAPSVARLREAPWYSWLGGILGTYYIIVNILIVPKLGEGTVLGVFVCAQVVMASIIDHFGLTGVTKRRLSVLRILGLLLLIGCVAVICIF